MKLYYMPGACSLAAHIALCEAEVPVDLVEVSYLTRRMDDGGDYRAVNPKGTVPALRLAGGELLTEVPVILQFVADAATGVSLLPAGRLPRLRALEWLNFIATEIHKSFSPLFRPTTPEAFLAPGKAHLRGRLGFVENHLSGQSYLVGQQFSLADAYLFATCLWLDSLDLPIAAWPSLQKHFHRIGDRESVQRALAREGWIG